MPMPELERLEPCEAEGEFDSRADAVSRLLFAADALPEEHLEASKLALLSATDAVAQSEGSGVDEDVRRDVEEVDEDAVKDDVAVPQLVFETIHETRLEIDARALAEALLVRLDELDDEGVVDALTLPVLFKVSALLSVIDAVAET